MFLQNRRVMIWNNAGMTTATIGLKNFKNYDDYGYGYGYEYRASQDIGQLQSSIQNNQLISNEDSKD